MHRYRLVAALLLVLAALAGVLPAAGEAQPFPGGRPKPTPTPEVRMGRLSTAGFETRDSGSLIEVAAAYDTTTVHGGAASAKCDSGAGNAARFANDGVVVSIAGGSSATYVHFVRAYLYFANLPSSTVTISSFASWTADAGNGTGVRMTSGGALIAAANGNESSASATTLTTGVWYRLEYKVTNVITANTSRVATVDEVRIDGTSLSLTATATVNNANPGGLIQPQHGWIQAPGASKIVYVDDVALNDDQGANQNTWPGDGKVVLLLPISDSVRDSLWTGGVGGTTNLWQAVDNTPPVGTATETDTSQIEHAGGAAGTTDDYEANMTSYNTAGLVSGDTVKVVQLVVCHGEDIATGTKVLSSEVLSNPAIASSGNFNAGDNVGALGTYPTNWRVHRGAVTYDPSVTLGTSPVMRVRRPETASRVASVCFMGMTVEYAPPSDATGTVSTGSLSVAGQAVAGTVAVTGTVATQSLAVAGQTVSAQAGAVGTVATQSLAVSGQAITGTGGATSDTGTVATGSHAVSGQSVAAQAGALGSVGTGAHAVSGQDVVGTAGVLASLTTGTHAVAGQSVQGVAESVGQVSTGSHAVAGEAGNGLAGSVGAVGTGSHAVAGQAVSVVAGAVGTFATGAHAVAGQSVAGQAGALGLIATGSHAVAGQSVSSLTGTLATVGTGSHAVAGQTVIGDEGGGSVMGAVATGGLAVSGQSVAGQAGTLALVGAGAHAVGGQPVAASAGSVGTVSPASIAVTGQPVAASVADLAAILAGEYAVTGQGVAAQAGTLATIQAGGLSVAGQPVVGIALSATSRPAWDAVIARSPQGLTLARTVTAGPDLSRAQQTTAVMGTAPGTRPALARTLPVGPRLTRTED